MPLQKVARSFPVLSRPRLTVMPSQGWKAKAARVMTVKRKRAGRQ